MDLSNASKEELQAELNKREELENAPPPAIPDELINWDHVIAIAAIEIKEVVSGEYHEDSDNNQYIYEAVMKAIYGPDYFKWFNKNT